MTRCNRLNPLNMQGDMQYNGGSEDEAVLEPSRFGRKRVRPKHLMDYHVSN